MTIIHIISFTMSAVAGFNWGKWWAFPVLIIGLCLSAINFN